RGARSAIRGLSGRGERIMSRVLPLALIAVALLSVVPVVAQQPQQVDPQIQPQRVDQRATDLVMHEGKFVKGEGNQVTMADNNGKEHQHTLAPDAKVMLDNKASRISDLKNGMKIRVWTPKNDIKTVHKIEAVEAGRDFNK